MKAFHHYNSSVTTSAPKLELAKTRPRGAAEKHHGQSERGAGSAAPHVQTRFQRGSSEETSEETSNLFSNRPVRHVYCLEERSSQVILGGAGPLGTRTRPDNPLMLSSSHKQILFM